MMSQMHTVVNPTPLPLIDRRILNSKIFYIPVKELYIIFHSEHVAFRPLLRPEVVRILLRGCLIGRSLLPPMKFYSHILSGIRT